MHRWPRGHALPARGMFPLRGRVRVRLTEQSQWSEDFSVSGAVGGRKLKKCKFFLSDSCAGITLVFAAAQGLKAVFTSIFE